MLSCKLNSTCDCIHILRAMVEVMGARAGIDKLHTNRLLVAIDEVFANICQHGYHGHDGMIEIQMDMKDNILHFEFKDHAPPFLLDYKRPYRRAIDDVQPGGLGMHLIYTVMDEVRHEVLDHGNRWVLTKEIETGEQA